MLRKRWTAALGVIVAGVIVTGVIATGTSLALTGSPAQAVNPVATYPKPAVASADQARSASAAVDAEDLRLIKARRGSGMTELQRENRFDPYTLGRGTDETLVLTARVSPYTLADIRALAPASLVRKQDGSYLLSEHIVVMPHATLHLSEPGGLELRLASGPQGFASIVSLGGKLELKGETNAPIQLSSWDVDAASPDTAPYDGRAYVRAVGGTFTAEHLEASALGFWSGRTGGLAVTGPDQLRSAALEQPSSDRRVSTRISDTSVTGNAFGLFLSGVDGVSIKDTKVKDSLGSGVVLHRSVRNGALSRTSSSHNGGSGFLMDRDTSRIKLDRTTANDNAASGFTVSSQPVSRGSSLDGASAGGQGNNSITNSTASGNSRYGVHIVGGDTIAVRHNKIANTEMGIVVTGPAQNVSITGNEVSNAKRHGISVVNRVNTSTVTGNVVDRASTGIYLRDSVAQVRGNTIRGAQSHGVSLVGQVDGTQVADNVLAGHGASALDTVRSSEAVSANATNDNVANAAAAANEVDGWDQPWYFFSKKLLQPMTIMWSIIAVIMLLTAVRSRREGPIVHPYAHQMAHQGRLQVPSSRVVEQTFEPKTMMRLPT